MTALRMSLMAGLVFLSVLSFAAPPAAAACELFCFSSSDVESGHDSEPCVSYTELTTEGRTYRLWVACIQ